MQRKNVLALACGLLLSGCISANAADLRFSNGPGLITAPTGYIGGSNVLPMDLNQAAVVNGGISTLDQGYGLGLGSGLYGNNCVSQLPQGTQLVSDGLGQTAVILPGSVCMPALTGCNVSLVGPQGPSALSLIGSSCIPVASLPACPPLTRVTTTTTTTTTRLLQHRAARHIVRHHCLRRIIRRPVCKKVDFGS